MMNSLFFFNEAWTIYNIIFIYNNLPYSQDGKDRSMRGNQLDKRHHQTWINVENKNLIYYNEEGILIHGYLNAAGSNF